MTVALVALGCAEPPRPRFPEPAHTASEPTGTHSGAVPTGHSGTVQGPWDRPSPPECTLTAPVSVRPGPRRSIGEFDLYRVGGVRNGRCGGTGAAALPDAGGDGQPDLAMVCSHYTPAVLRVFDGTARGPIGLGDATSAVELGRLVQYSLTWGPLGGPLGAVVPIGYGGVDAPVVSIPLPAGTWPVDEVVSSVVTPYLSTQDSWGGVGDVDGDGAADLFLSGRNVFASLGPGVFGEGISVHRGPLQPVVPYTDSWATYHVAELEDPVALGDSPGVLSVSGLAGQFAAGDLDGDGAEEVLLGGDLIADFYEGPRGSTIERDGGVILFFGGTPGIHGLAEARAVVYGTCGAWLGGWQGPVGDVTGDGRPDVALAGYTTRVDTLFQGAVFVFSDLAATEGYRNAGTADAVILGESGEEGWLGEFGRIGDLNGDGVDDLVLGAPRARGGGRAYVFLGPVSGTISAADADLVLLPEVRDDGLGYKVGGAGDVDGDGVPDVWVASPGAWFGGQPDEGAVHVLSGALLLAAMAP